MRPLSRIVPDAIRRRYALKFGIALLAVVVAVGTIGVVATNEVESEMRSILSDEHETLAQQEAQALESWSKRNEQRIRTIAKTPGLLEADDVDLHRYIQFSSESHSVHVVNLEDGEILASTVDGYAGNGIERVGPAAIADHDDPSRVYMTEPYRFEADDEAVVSYVHLLDSDGNAVIYTVSLELFGNTFHSAGNDEPSTVIVVDDQNRIVLDDSTFGTNGRLFLETYDAQRVAAGSVETIADEPGETVLSAGYDFPNEEYVVGSVDVGTGSSVTRDSRWTLLVHTPTADAYGIVQDVGQWGTIATLGGVLLITAVGVVLGRNTAAAADELTTKAGQIEAGNLDVDFETHRIDNVGRLYWAFDSMQTSLRRQLEEVEAARERTERLNRELERTAGQYSEVMRAAGEGDFTARMEPNETNEAMASIAVEFNEMLAEIEETVERVQSFSNQVATASEQVTASSEEVQTASEQVTESVQEISDGAERQNRHLQTATQEMNGFSTTIEEIAASSNQVADLAERSAEIGERGREAAQETIEGLNEIESESAQAVTEIEALQAEIDRIDELVEFITQVAEQTNMLALNANIEAARSTAGGDEGFGVVAEEVKELAAETKEATADIEDLIEQITSQTDRTAEEVRKTSEQIASHRSTIEGTVEALEQIARYDQETAEGVQDISAATEQQATSTQEIVAMVDEAATIAEETTTEAQTVAAAAEEQTTALTEVTDSMSELSEQAGRLSSALDRFDTDADVDPTTLEFEAENDANGIGLGFDERTT